MDGVRELAQRVKRNVEQVIVGKSEVIEQMIIAMIASGHVLLEDVPGTGKTLLAKTLAKSLGCEFKRIQFTPDLLPADLSGIHFFSQKSGEFEFRPGPLFTHILLADELNRATPRTQSSLLECMEERQVTIDGQTKPLERPFFVIATQNPVENQGTFPLPEAQLDRFLMKIKMGYPTAQESADILRRFKESNPLVEIAAVALREDIIMAQDNYAKVRVDDRIITYIVEIVERTRSMPEVELGVSPRGSQALLKTVQIAALLAGRDYVTPDDVKRMVPSVLTHRLQVQRTSRSRSGGDAAAELIMRILQETPVPTEDKLQSLRA